MWKKMAAKFVLLGIDGADWKIIDALAAEGALPNLAKMKEEGSHASLRSTIPPLTAPAWNSIFTGVNPGKHGIFSFATLAEGKRRYTSGAERLVPYFWDLMHDQKILAYNIPCAYPVRASENTVLVSGFCTPGPESDFASPLPVKDEILRLVPDYDFNHVLESDMRKSDGPGGKMKAMESISRSLDGRLKVASHLMQTKEWDAAFIVFSETDWIQHYFMHEFVHSGHKRESQIGRIYMRIDAFLGTLLQKGYNVMVVSDHGFRLARRHFHLNTFLIRSGSLKLRTGSRRHAMQRLGLTRDRVISLLPGWLIRRIRKLRPLSRLGLSVFPSKAVSEDNIDFGRSRAYLFTNSGGIMLSEPSLKGAVAAEVEGSVDESGRKPVEGVFARESIYHGEGVHRAPHLVAMPSGDNALSTAVSASLSREIDPETELTGYHDVCGVFISSGPDFLKKGRMDELSLLDIAPTVLSLFGYPAPADMDGRMIGILHPSPMRDGLKSGTLHAIKKLARRREQRG